MVLFLAGFYSSTVTEKYFREKDSSRIVIDEFVALPLCLLFIEKTAVTIALGFFVFRFFDILKPFPIRRIETALSAGLSVMLDDTLAAVYANIVVHIVYNLVR
ncbi:MAG: phosphatidylglycerophosphatase A [Nitrospirae bacterium]|nr:MAG: phosphatidylglycerophosphatase A [Nitrospirota bacterium]